MPLYAITACRAAANLEEAKRHQLFARSTVYPVGELWK